MVLSRCGSLLVGQDAKQSDDHMTALPDHRGGRIWGLAARLGGIAPAAGASIVRSRLFLKYVALFVAVVSLALVANGAFDVYFSYQEQKTALDRIQRDSGMNSVLRVRQVADYLQQSPERPVSVGALAEMANLSVSHFCALFKRTTGFAPVDYLLHMRIQRACELLDTTDQPIKRIAGEMGFSDALYFSRTFRKVHGISPTAYRSIAKG